ncbi:MAG: hypothetical protein ABI763_00635 [Bacteroidota bacterium]
MKKLFTHFLSFILAASVLFASTGVVIASHICHESKKADITLFEGHGCCTDLEGSCKSFPAPQGQLKNNCCELTISYHKLEVFSPGKISLKQVAISLPVEQFLFQNIPVQSNEILTVNTGEPLSFQRLKPGTKNFLFTIHTLLI